MSKDSSIPSVCRGMVTYGIRDYRLEEDVPVRMPEEGEVLIRVTRCGICAGDAKCWIGAPMFWGDEHRKPYVQTPVVPGHEFCGEVVALGKAASEKHGGLEIGDQVTSEQVVACGVCLYCQKGLRWLCEPHDIYGFHINVPGGMQEYMTFPAHAIVHKIPNRISPEEACYIEPLSCSVHGVERGRIEIGDTVVIAGCGPIGLGMVAAAKLRSPGTLIAVDCNDNRLEIARECGAQVVLNPMRDNVVQRIKEMTGNYGCDVYIEASGNPKSVEQGLLSVRKAGRFVEFSVFNTATTVDWTIIGDTKELDIYGAHCSGDTGYKQAISIVESLPMSRIISHQPPLAETVQGIQLVNQGTDSVKVTIDPHL